MSEIIKTEAFVLTKINYSNSSNIVSLFTKDHGRLSAIVKGARGTKTKIGKSVDLLNHLSVIFYKKDTREVQVLTNSDIISHYSKIKDDFEKLKRAQAVIELIKKLMPEHEVNKRLFSGIERVLYLFEHSNQNPKILFGRFFIFFLTEIGYEIQLDKCASCGGSQLEDQELAYNFEMGILCAMCKKNHLESFSIDSELFNCLHSLKNNKQTNAGEVIIQKSITFMELYLKYHVSNFKGIQSLKMI